MLFRSAKVQGDKSLQDQLNADGADPVAIAKEAGFMIAADDLKKAQSKISDKELESTAGGANHAQTNPTDYQSCTCGAGCHYP